jgi:hypothetical protein
MILLKILALKHIEDKRYVQVTYVKCGKNEILTKPTISERIKYEY